MLKLLAIHLSSPTRRLAALAVDESECVVVMDTLWFRYPLVPEWETQVMAALVECKIMDVYAPGLLLSLKKMAPEEMNVYVDPEPNKLNYPCKMCHKKSCAVTKAYLLWRRLTKREPCNLMHGTLEKKVKPITLGPEVGEKGTLHDKSL
ncbi:uncharacterized protein TNCT_75501 [Trichonephila clavata]|uniref:Uncharacterized protein n=1 Tax=Trichonephila clavata TaxID=2740835 RepID=A0A8X6FQ27_TRICU|nr:uncharacterized protein TNCT_75501 [Trichonephila clavata]